MSTTVITSKGGATLPTGLCEAGDVSPGDALSVEHAAFDAYILGIRPDHVIEIRDDILREVDGPMLRHGLQAIAGALLQLPRDPRQHRNRDFLGERYELFRKAG